MVWSVCFGSLTPSIRQEKKKKPFYCIYTSFGLGDYGKKKKVLKENGGIMLFSSVWLT